MRIKSADDKTKRLASTQAYISCSNPPIKLAPPNPNPAIVSGAKSNSLAMDSGRKKLVCLNCNAKISFEEGKFCRNNDRLFKGGQYCRMHQAGF